MSIATLDALAPTPRVTVVIATYNGASRGLSECLTALARQSYPARLRDVVVVDDCSRDDTAVVAHQFGCHLVRHAVNLGVGAARQSGLLRASGELVAFIDDDVRPDPYWLAELVAAYALGPQVLGVGGWVQGGASGRLVAAYQSASGYGCPAPVNPHRSSRPMARLAHYLQIMWRNPTRTATRPMEVHDIYTGNASFRRSALQAVGGFDVGLRSSEDTDLCARLHDHFPDGQLIFAPRALITHEHLDRLGPLLRTAFGRADGTYQAAAKRRRLPPVFPFPLLLAVGAGAVGVLATPTAGAAVLVAGPGLLYAWWWPRTELKARRRWAFTYLQALDEAAANTGLAMAYWRAKKTSGGGRRRVSMAD